MKIKILKVVEKKIFKYPISKIFVLFYFNISMHGITIDQDQYFGDYSTLQLFGDYSTLLLTINILLIFTM